MNALPAPVMPAAVGRSDARTLAFLADLSQALAVTLDLRTTLSEAVTRIAEFMQAEAASLFLLEPGTNVLECRICVGPVDLTGLRLAVGQGVVGRAAAENLCQFVEDAETDARVWRASDDDSGFVTRSLIAAPLSTAIGPIGVLEIINKRAGGRFDAADAEVLRLLAAPTALAINSARMAHELLDQQRMRREFDLARKLQKSLLPKRRRGGFPLLGVNVPAHEISGDFYDYFDLPDGRVGFVIGDISGKGLDAALLMVRAASLLRWAGKEGMEPTKWLARVNDELCETSHDGRFVCALVGYCDRNGRRARFSGAGFPPALLYRQGQFEEFPSDGPPLGILPNMQYAEREVALGAGSLYFFSDGVTDVRDAANRTIGHAGMRALIERHGKLAPEPRLRAVLSELKHLKLVDDTTVLVVEAPRAHAAERLLERHFPAQPEQMRELRADLRQALNDLAVDPVLRDKLVLVVDEACCNVIRHAYGNSGLGSIGFTLTREHDALVFELVDAAPPVDPARVRPQPLGECRAGGLGVALIDHVMDEWRIEPLPVGGNRLRMVKRLAPLKEDLA